MVLVSRPPVEGSGESKCAVMMGIIRKPSLIACMRSVTMMRPCIGT